MPLCLNADLRGEDEFLCMGLFYKVDFSQIRKYFKCGCRFFRL